MQRVRKLNKMVLLEKGTKLLRNFCTLNGIKPFDIHVVQPGERYYNFNSCAFYLNGAIYIMPAKCAPAGNGVRAWSWPGNTVDRTPYGVLQHELGHYLDDQHDSTLSIEWGKLYDKPLTNYHGTRGCSAMAEDFAEIFRLFVTNPNLLRRIRPKSWRYLAARFVTAEKRSWYNVLRIAPLPIIRAARNKIQKGEGGNR